MNVWNLSLEWQQLDQLLEESCGELTPEVEAHMETLVTASKDAVESAGFYRLWLDTQEATCKARRAALAASLEVINKKYERLDAALVVILQKTGKQKFPEFTLSTTTRENVAFAPAPGVDLIDLPSQFVRYSEPVLNLTALKEARKAGTLPPEVEAVATETTGVMLRKATQKAQTETAAA
jgi:hypothetical protein